MTATDRLNGTFGFDPLEGQHHFLVVVRPGDRDVVVYECPRFLETSQSEIPVGSLERVQVPAPIWKAIAEPVRATFNLRLKEAKRKPGKWRAGQNYLAPHYGKELVLLAWALEDIPVDKAEMVFRNWRGLAPEERWWLYSTANAPFSQDSKRGRGVGWRKALSIALSENPLVDAPGETGIKPVVTSQVSPSAGAKKKAAPKNKNNIKKTSNKKKALSKDESDQTVSTAKPAKGSNVQNELF